MVALWSLWARRNLLRGDQTHLGFQLEGAPVDKSWKNEDTQGNHRKSTFDDGHTLVFGMFFAVKSPCHGRQSCETSGWSEPIPPDSRLPKILMAITWNKI